jgi:hypothetical protein
MDVRVLHIDDCPNWREAGVRTRQALDALGLADASVDFVLIRTEREAADAAFAGSPTIVVDGSDLFPSEAPTAALACRLYFTEHAVAGLPSQEQIERALLQRAEIAEHPS